VLVDEKLAVVPCVVLQVHGGLPRRRPWLARPHALDHLAVIVVAVPAHSTPAPVRGAAHVYDAVDVEGALPRRDARLLAVLPLVWPEAGLGEKGVVAALAVDVKVQAGDVLVGRLPQLGFGTIFVVSVLSMMTCRLAPSRLASAMPCAVALAPPLCCTAPTSSA